MARPLSLHYNHYVSLVRPLGLYYNLAQSKHYNNYVHGQLVKMLIVGRAHYCQL